MQESNLIYEALLVPREAPHTLRELKRALLTYDKVILIDPSDRDMMPSNAFMSNIMGMPIFGIDTGPVRPMGKILDYDEQFSKTLDAVRKAVSEELIEVRSTYQQEVRGQLTIGAVLTGGYPLNINTVFWLYRSMASNLDFLSDAVRADFSNLIRSLDSSPELAPSGVGDGGINNLPPLPSLDEKIPSEQTRSALTMIARSRLASFIKYAGYCEAKNLVPIFSADSYGLIAQRLLKNAKATFSADDNDMYWSKRSKVLELCHEEFLIDSRLDDLSVEKVIQLRTKAWGKQAKAREGLFESVFSIAKNIENESDFSSKVMPLIHEYRKQSGDVVRERERLSFEIKCDLGKAALAGVSALAGLLQLESPLESMGLTLMAGGGIWALDRAKEYVPALRELRAQENEMKRGAGFGLHNFYSKLSG